MNNDDKELNEILEESSSKNIRKFGNSKPRRNTLPDEIAEEPLNVMSNLVQWTTSDGKRFWPASRTKDRLTPGVYEIKHCSQSGLFFEKLPVKTEGLIRFPQSNSDKVVQEIQNFWSRESKFREHFLTYKRGIILWGPPGSGKSCTIQIIIQDVVDREGVVVKFINPSLFIEGMRSLREIQKDTPVVVLMEDIDSILEHYSESEVLNILDGVEEVDKTVFLATTNYPEELGARIINRPSRFDKRFKIDHPNAESRRIYFEHLIGKDKIREYNIDINLWVKDTEKFSIAHLKELFVAVIILGDKYENAIETLRTMKEEIKPCDGFDRSLIGFGGNDGCENKVYKNA